MGLQNFLTYSSDWSNVIWVDVAGSSVTQSTVAAGAPDGSAATRLSATGSGTKTHYFRQIAAGATGVRVTVTLSAYVKYDGTTAWCVMGDDSHANFYRQVFNIQTGALGSADANVSASVDTLANGWFRVSMTYTIPPNETSNPTTIRYFIGPTTGSAIVTGQYVAAGETMLVWGAQLVKANWAGDYAATTAATVGATTPPRNRVLVQLQNLLQNSEKPNTSPWLVQGANFSVSENSATDPFGGSTAATLTYAAGGGGGNVDQNFVTVKGATYTFSWWAKLGTLSQARYSIRDVTNAVFLSQQVAYAAVVGTWTRFVVTFVATSTSTTVYPEHINAESAGTMFIWGMQVVKANWSGDYVSTTTAAVGANTPPRNKNNTSLQNLILQSEDFNTTWTKSNCSITVNQTTAPDGNVTADAVIASSTSSTLKRVLQTEPNNPVAIGQVASFSIYAKPGAVSWIQIVLNGVNNFAYFNLSGAGSIGTLSGTGTTATIEATSNGFYRCTVLVAARVVSATNCYVAPANADSGSTYAASDSVSAQLYLWGAQYAQANWAGDYVATTTVAVGSTTPPRNKNFLTENLLQWGNDLSQSPWQALGTVTWSSNQIANPIDGSLTAGGLRDVNGTTSNWNFRQNTVTALAGKAGITCNFSAWVKAGTQTWCILGVNNANQLNWFDLTNGVVGLAQSGSNNIAIESWGNGWYRCNVTFVPSPGATGQIVSVYAAPSNSIASFTGTGGIPLYAYAFQVNRGSSPGPFALTAATAINGGGIRTQLRHRQNLLTFSEQFDNAIWVKTLCTITADQVANPLGSAVTADAFVDSNDGAPASHFLSYTVSQAVGQIYTLSVYAKASAGQWLALAPNGAGNIAYFDLTNGVVGSINGAGSISNRIDAIGNGWYRCSYTFFGSFASTSSRIYAAANNGTLSYQGAATTRMLLWGAQQVTGYDPGLYQLVTTSALNSGPIRKAS